MYKFNNTNLVTSYIKAKMADFNLPCFAVWKSGMQVYQGCFYIKDNVIVRALSSGTFTEITTDNFHVVYDNYIFGAKYLNLTKSFVINTLDYDSYTHEFLGDYLRFYRDYYGVDLMSLYNCFSNRTVTDLSLSWTATARGTGARVTKEFNDKDGSKIYAIPVRPGNKYTIYYDCDADVELVAGYYYNGIVDVFNQTSYSFNYATFYSKHSHTSFNKPFLYDKLVTMPSYDEKTNIKVYNQAENLKLFIKVPAANMINKTPTLIVLEGDYTGYQYAFDGQDYNLVPSNSIICDETSWTVNSEEYKTKLGLTKLDTYVNYPFSDRLVEYLFENVIVPDDKIDTNISKLQTALRNNTTESLSSFGLTGVWNDHIRETIYKLAKEKNLINDKYDILGYCDKDVESVINIGV